MSNILVTGGTGQIGQYLCQSLLSDSQNRVYVYDFKPGRLDPSLPADRIKVLTGDVLDFEELLSTIKVHDISQVVHLAALLVLESKERPAKALRVNCVGTNNVFEAARIMDLERIIFTSSVVVYGSPEHYPSRVVNEGDFPRCPPEPYSITKFVNETMNEFYRETYGISSVCMRLTGTWGPGRYSGYTGQFNNFLKNAALGEAVTLPSDFTYRGAKLRWLYVRDMGECIAHATMVEGSKIRSPLYNVGSSRPYNAFDVIDSLKEIVPEAKIDFEETDRPTKTSSTIAGPSGLDVDCSRLYEELGYRERFGMKDALRDLINYERANA